MFQIFIRYFKRWYALNELTNLKENAYLWYEMHINTKIYTEKKMFVTNISIKKNAFDILVYKCFENNEEFIRTTSYPFIDISKLFLALVFSFACNYSFFITIFQWGKIPIFYIRLFYSCYEMKKKFFLSKFK